MATFPTDQRWYNLAAILSIPFSLPMIVIGYQLAKMYGPGVAICSILVGNLFLWLVGFAVISMASENRSNAIDNVRSYLGPFGAILMWIVMIISILNWLTFQLNANIPSIGAYFQIQDPIHLVILGSAIGIFITLITMGGIQVLKWLTITTAPFIILYYLFAIFRSEYSIDAITFGISVPAVIATVLVLLPGVINLPTLYRYSHSKPDSYLGLSIMFFLISFFEISTIWMQFTDTFDLVFNGYSVFAFATLLFLLITLTCINFINIYYLSALWESSFPRFTENKRVFIFGLLGTACYAFIKANTPIQVLANLMNSFLGSLGIVLLIAYLIRILIQHRPRKFEQTLNSLSWIIGCAVSATLIAYDIDEYVQPLLMGAIASASSFLIIIFIEENIWAAKKVLSHKDNY